ncbi:MAG: TfoX/Sxy family protein [Chloroflexota bacterium]|nr:TfoX/Sxy family protein [Chloroflexota bacterium]
MNQQPTLTPEEKYAALCDSFLGTPGVTSPLNNINANNKFGSSELKIHNKIFAMLSKGRLVVKLPKSRVDALVATGDGQRFDPRGDGRMMKEWLALEPASEKEWLLMAREAMEFVGAKGK